MDHLSAHCTICACCWDSSSSKFRIIIMLASPRQGREMPIPPSRPLHSPTPHFSLALRMQGGNVTALCCHSLSLQVPGSHQLLLIPLTHPASLASTEILQQQAQLAPPLPRPAYSRPVVSGHRHQCRSKCSHLSSDILVGHNVELHFSTSPSCQYLSEHFH